MPTGDRGKPAVADHFSQRHFLPGRGESGPHGRNIFHLESAQDLRGWNRSDIGCNPSGEVIRGDDFSAEREVVIQSFQRIQVDFPLESGNGEYFLRPEFRQTNDQIVQMFFRKRRECHQPEFLLPVSVGDFPAEQESGVENQFVDFLVTAWKRNIRRNQSGGAPAQECFIFQFSQMHRQSSCGSFLRARSGVRQTDDKVAAKLLKKSGADAHSCRV